MEKNILHSIFFDEYNHWDKLVDKYGQRIREVVQSEVNKFRHCGEIVRGFRLFVCEGCNDGVKLSQKICIKLFIDILYLRLMKDCGSYSFSIGKSC